MIDKHRWMGLILASEKCISLAYANVHYVQKQNVHIAAHRYTTLYKKNMKSRWNLCILIRDVLDIPLNDSNLNIYEHFSIKIMFLAISIKQ